MGERLSTLFGKKRKVLPLDSPWRNTKKGGNFEWNGETEVDLRQEYIKIVPDDKRDTINILLVGLTGAGKSSYINSMQSALSDRIVRRAHVEKDDKTVTSVLSTVCSFDEERTNFKFIDAPGVTKTKYYELFLKMALEGKIKENTELSAFETRAIYLTEGDQTATGDVDLSNSECVADEGDERLIPSMVVIVLRANKPKEETGPFVDRLNYLRKLARANRVNIAVVLTAVDEASQVEMYPIKGKNAQYIFRSPAVKEAVEDAFQFTNIPQNSIFPVVNYTDEAAVLTEVNILHLYTLREILHAAMDGYRNRTSSTGVAPRNTSK